MAENDFKVYIMSRAMGEAIIAFLPEEITLGVESNWDASSFKFATLGKITHAAFGTMVQSYFMTWDGTSPITMNLPLEFRAKKDSWKEVVEPCSKLQKLALPYGSSGTSKISVLRPPGPNPFNESKGDRISIRMGRFLQFTNVVLTHVEVMYSSIISRDGHPMKAVANVTFQTSRIITREAFDRIYRKRVRLGEEGS